MAVGPFIVLPRARRQQRETLGLSEEAGAANRICRSLLHGSDHGRGGGLCRVVGRIRVGRCADGAAPGPRGTLYGGETRDNLCRAAGARVARGRRVMAAPLVTRRRYGASSSRSTRAPTSRSRRPRSATSLATVAHAVGAASGVVRRPARQVVASHVRAWACVGGYAPVARSTRASADAWSSARLIPRSRRQQTASCRANRLCPCPLRQKGDGRALRPRRGRRETCDDNTPDDTGVSDPSARCPRCRPLRGVRSAGAQRLRGMAWIRSGAEEHAAPQEKASCHRRAQPGRQAGYIRQSGRARPRYEPARCCHR